MKKLTREVTKEVVAGYESVDGIVFDTEEDCLEYEKSYKGVIRAAYRRRVVNEISEYMLLETGSDDTIFDMVSIQSTDDLTAVNQYIYICHGRQLSESVIGTVQLIGHTYGYEFDGAWCIGTIEEYFEGVMKRYKEKLTHSTEE